MENNRKIKVGITHGDINGIGYEVILKAFSDATMLELCTPIIYGSPKVATYDMQPEMSAYEVTDKLLEAIDTDKYGKVGLESFCTKVKYKNLKVKRIEVVDDWKTYQPEF